MTRFLLLGSLGMLMYGTFIYGLYKANEPVKYDCSLASFHPDYPAKVRKACREAKP